MNNNEIKQLSAKTCFGHLGGTLGNRLFERLVELGWLESDGQKRTVFTITPKGAEEFTNLGINIYERR